MGKNRRTTSQMLQADASVPRGRSFIQILLSDGSPSARPSGKPRASHPKPHFTPTTVTVSCPCDPNRDRQSSSVSNQAGNGCMVKTKNLLIVYPPDGPLQVGPARNFSRSSPLCAWRTHFIRQDAIRLRVLSAKRDRSSLLTFCCFNPIGANARCGRLRTASSALRFPGHGSTGG